jgi:hypothetical protein
MLEGCAEDEFQLKNRGEIVDWKMVQLLRTALWPP